MTPNAAAAPTTQPQADAGPAAPYAPSPETLADIDRRRALHGAWGKYHNGMANMLGPVAVAAGGVATICSSIGAAVANNKGWTIAAAVAAGVGTIVSGVIAIKPYQTRAQLHWAKESAAERLLFLVRERAVTREEFFRAYEELIAPLPNASPQPPRGPDKKGD